MKFLGEGDDSVRSTSNAANASETLLFANKPAKKNPSPGDGNARSWKWFPTWSELKSHYLREIGFLASLFQFGGATIFWISGFTALPGINDKLSQGLLDGIYWTPQIVGGTGFIISGCVL